MAGQKRIALASPHLRRIRLAFIAVQVGVLFMAMYVFAMEGIPYVYRQLPVKVVIAQDVSLPYKVFLWKRYRPGEMEILRGDLVEFVPPVQDLYTSGKVLIKEVRCLPGEEMGVTPVDTDHSANRYFCNGALLGTSKKYDTLGRVLPQWVHSGRIDGYFVMGTNPRSYDSRYFGPIRESDVIALVYPLF